MKINFHFKLLKGLLSGLIVVLFCASGWSQSTSIKLVDVVMPNTFVLNSTVTISGKFKNDGTTPYNGSLGLHLQVKDDMNSGVGYYYSSDIHSVGVFSIQPGQEVAFSTTVNVVQSLFKASKDIIIIFPKIGNETTPTMTPYTKEVGIN